jgi:hypothetical protein
LAAAASSFMAPRCYLRQDVSVGLGGRVRVCLGTLVQNVAFKCAVLVPYRLLDVLPASTYLVRCSMYPVISSSSSQKLVDVSLLLANDSGWLNRLLEGRQREWQESRGKGGRRSSFWREKLPAGGLGPSYVLPSGGGRRKNGPIGRKRSKNRPFRSWVLPKV